MDVSAFTSLPLKTPAVAPLASSASAASSFARNARAAALDSADCVVDTVSGPNMRVSNVAFSLSAPAVAVQVLTS
jgi:hypothetical protein